MYHVDLAGTMTFEKLNLKEERVDLLQNPLLGPFLRRRHLLEEDEVMIRRVNKIAIYFLNKDKKFDLDNYLMDKWVTPLDLVRAGWYWLSMATGYADTYRNEQFVPKSDLAYNHERKLLAINLSNPDPVKLAGNLTAGLAYDLGVLERWLERKMRR